MEAEKEYLDGWNVVVKEDDEVIYLDLEAFRDRIDIEEMIAKDWIEFIYNGCHGLVYDVIEGWIVPRETKEIEDEKAQA